MRDPGHLVSNQIEPDPSLPLVSFEQIQGTIGSLAWLWSGIERELEAALKELRGGPDAPPVHGISRSLEVWSTEILKREAGEGLQAALCQRLVRMLKEALVVRNLVCHGLKGIHAQSSDASSEAYLVVQLGEVQRTLPWSELQTMFAWMSRAPWLICDLTTAALSADPGRSSEQLQHWDCFPSIR